MLGRRQEINLQITQLLDICLLVLSIWLAYWFRSDLAPRFWPNLVPIPPFQEFYWLMALIGPFTPIALEACGFYTNLLRKNFGTSVLQILQACLRIGIGVAFFEVFLRWDIPSRSVVIFGALLGILALLARESFTKRALRIRLAAGHIAKERVLLAGRLDDVTNLLENMPDDQRAEIEVVGRYDVIAEPLQNLVTMLHEKSVSRVIFAVRHVHFDKIEEAVQACEIEGVEAWLSADFFQTALSRPSFDVLGGKLMLVFHSAPKISWSLLVKDFLDRVGAFLIILMTLPIWLVAMIGIKMSSRGPVFFTQSRAGRHGNPFRMVKFRTMGVDAEEIRKELEKSNEMSGPVFKIKQDPRVFPFGKWLRRLSIDELPQMINVLQGEMSLVGPRPLPVYEIEKIEKHAQRRRLSVKPGMTCLWQVMGRSSITSFEDWVALDLKYIDNWSLLLDAKILIKTLPAVLRGSGAH